MINNQVSLLGSTKVVTMSLSELISHARKSSEGGKCSAEVESKAKVKANLDFIETSYI